jgi:imidazolonepropionase-like amidohydrolase
VLTSLSAITENTGTPEQIRAAVRKMAADGADVIKMFATRSIRDGGGTSLTEEQIRAACEEARAQGKRIVVHAHDAAGAKAAIRAGANEIEHGFLLDDEAIDLMAQHGTYFDPTFFVIFNDLEYKPRLLGLGNYTEQGFGYLVNSIPHFKEVARKAVERKVKVVLGTDADAGAHGHNAEEFIYRVRDGGQKPMEALMSATSIAAAAMNLGDRIGAIAPGMEADIVATDGNPLEDITAVRRVAFVMKGGKVYKAAPPGRVLP